MRLVAEERRQFGYRRVHLMLERQGWLLNQKKFRRLCREEELQEKRRGGRKQALGTRRPMLVPDSPNERWSLDARRCAKTYGGLNGSLSDTFTDGRKFRVLAIVEDFSRECLGLVADTLLSGLRVTRELSAIMTPRDRPKTVVSELPSVASSVRATMATAWSYRVWQFFVGARIPVLAGTRCLAGDRATTCPEGASQHRTSSRSASSEASETNYRTRRCSRYSQRG